MIFPTAPRRPFELKSSLRQIRMIHFAMIVGMALYLYVLYILKGNSTHSQPADPGMSGVMVAIGIVDIAVILFVRRFMLDKAVAALRLSPADQAAILRWRTAMILTSAGLMSVFLFGWMLCFLGTPLTWTYILLWSIAAIGFVIFIPQMPVDEMSLIQHDPPPGP
ncbi:MAG: hypothetical protein ACM3JB_04340 [Acidobacteriaceae bacterium]